jgi:hypothetical protein
MPIDANAEVEITAFRWVPRGEPIRLEGAAVQGQEFWKWLMAAALACLLLELAILTRSQVATANVTATNIDFGSRSVIREIGR